MTSDPKCTLDLSLLWTNLAVHSDKLWRFEVMDTKGANGGDA